jgi:hypothetical protein
MDLEVAMRKLIVAAVAASFAFAAQAADDKAKAGASATTDKSSAAAGASQTGNKGADAMFNALDKNRDGFLTREEAKGTPHDKDFTTLDKDSDGKLTPQEHAAAPEHAGDKAAAGGTKSEPGKTESKPKY